MKRKSKYKFEIGDMFSSWKVIKCVDKKKYRYLCKCECDKEKVFYKYNLLKGKYAPCKNCAHLGEYNLKEIKISWNNELNGCNFKETLVNNNSMFWFKCKKGHNFKSTIKDFSYNKCLSCKKTLDKDFIKEQVLEYLYKLSALIFNSVESEMGWVIINDIKLAIYIEEKDRRSNFKKYVSSESDLLKEVHILKEKTKEFKEKGYEVEVIKIENNFVRSVDKIQEKMIRWIYPMNGI